MDYAGFRFVGNGCHVRVTCADCSRLGVLLDGKNLTALGTHHRVETYAANLSQCARMTALWAEGVERSLDLLAVDLSLARHRKNCLIPPRPKEDVSPLERWAFLNFIVLG